MANKIQFKRGLKAQLPTLADGEPGFATDTKEFYIGNSSGGNTRIPTESDYIRQPGYADTSGTANTYTAALNPALSSYTSGVALAVKINAANTGASTINVNGLGAKSILNSKGAALVAGKLVVGGVYTLRYNGTAFILQGEGGDYGTATAAEVLAGRTIGTENGLVTGTMPNNGTKVYTPSSGNVPIDTGYHVGSVVAAVAVPPDKVLAGTTIAGTAGSIPVKMGSEVVANSFRKSSTPGKFYLKPPQGYYDGSNSEVNWTDTYLVPENVRGDRTILGVSGNIPIKNASNGNGSISANHHVASEVSPANGHLFVRPNGAGGTGKALYEQDCWLDAVNPNFIPSNIRAGVNVFGLNGTLIEGKRWAKVSGPADLELQSSLQIPVYGLNFIPSLVFVLYSGSFSVSGYSQGGSGCAINNIVYTSFLAASNGADIIASITNADGNSCIVNIYNKRGSRFYIGGPGSIYLFE